MNHFLQNLAALAIRAQVIATLRSQCPAELQSALEDLLAQQQAVGAIQDFIASHLKTPAAITPDAILALALPERACELLRRNPDLLTYLATTARAKLGATQA